MRNSCERHSTWNMYLSSKFKCDNRAESSSVDRERDASAEEMSFSGDWDDGEGVASGGVEDMVKGRLID